MSKKSLVLMIGVIIIAAYIGIVGNQRWGDVAPPRVTLQSDFDVVGPETSLSVHVEDKETGLQRVSIHIEHNRETFTLVDETFPSHGFFSLDGGKVKTFDFEAVPFSGDAIPRRRGPATLVITARDYSWRGFFNGNVQERTHKFDVKFTPPRLEVLSAHEPIPQGGTGLVLYRVSSDAKTHGVKIGDAYFPGYPDPYRDDRQFALIAVPYNAKTTEPIELVAEDGLGNRAVQKLDYRIRRKKWRTRKIRISDRFIQKTVMSIIARMPELEDQGDPLNNFLLVNKTLRRQQTEQLKAFAQKTRPEFLWEGPFLQLSNSQVEAGFADHRMYIYHRKVVDTQDHLGFDLAVTKRYPVEAANSGIVIFADYFGIYGNTVIIDHGYGLQSLYAHLSSIDVKVEELVNKRQVIGHSGTTGLAAGDHLHFSLLVHGVQVDPTEWWDPQWVKTRIADRLGLLPLEDEEQKERQVPQAPQGPFFPPPAPEPPAVP